MSWRSPSTGGRPPATDYAIELRDIVKRFPGVVANDGVDLKVRRGTIHAIVGENGAGKSTLMKTLYGAHQPDEGTILVDGEVQHFRSPAAAIRHGIGMVFQHFMLADNFTVWENIVLGNEPGWPVLARNAARRKIRALGSRYGLEIDPDELVSDLGVGEKQRVEILKVLYRGAEILILDEPTAVLVPHEVDELFASLRELTASKATVHLHLPQARRGARVRRRDHRDPRRQDGRRGRRPVDGDRRAARRDDGRLRAAVAGDPREHGDRPGPARASPISPSSPTPTPARSPSASRRAPTCSPAPPVPVAAHRPLDGVSIEVHAGEIVGIAGVEGNGQSELIDAIVGLVPATGTVLARRRRHQQRCRRSTAAPPGSG